MTTAQAGPDPLADARRALLAERYGPPVRAWRPEAIDEQRAALNRALLAAATVDLPVDEDAEPVEIHSPSTDPSTGDLAAGQPDPHDDDEEVV